MQNDVFYNRIMPRIRDLIESYLVSSITAVYTQSGAVYDTDDLDTLKADLVVTALYPDGTSEIVPADRYTLSGTLEVGTSTITVVYSGKTTTFDVTVTGVLYSLFNHTFNNADPINTEIKLLETDREFTMTFDIDFLGSQKASAVWKVFNLLNGTSPYAGLALQRKNNNTGNVGMMQLMTDKTVEISSLTDSYSGNFKLVLRHSIGNTWEYWYKVGNNAVVNGTIISTFQSITNPLGIGGSHTGSSVFHGTFNSFILYPLAISNDRITAFIG